MSTKRKRPSRAHHRQSGSLPKLRCGVCGLVVEDLAYGVVVGEEGGGIIDFVHRSTCLAIIQRELEAVGYDDPVLRNEHLETFLRRVKG